MMKGAWMSVFAAALLIMAVPLSFAIAAGDDPDDDPFEDYIEIRTAADLAKIGVDEEYPLDGKYYLTGSIDFGDEDYSPGGVDMEIMVSMSGNMLVVDLYVNGVKPVTDGNNTFAWLLRTDTATAAYLTETFVGGSVTINNTFGGTDGVPNGTYILTVGGEEPFDFAYSCEVIVSGGSAKIASADANRTTFNSNGNFIPIGSKDLPFEGIFDGNGYVINGMHTAVFSSETLTYSGLFGFAFGAEIKDLGIANGSSVSISTKEYFDDWSYAGGIAGFSSATITGCYNSGLVSAASATNAIAGGISGMAQVQISGCYNSGPISAAAAVDAYAGGLIAWAQTGAHHDNYNIGTVSASSFSNAYAGGLIAWAQASSAEKSYNAGTVSACAPTDVYSGGIVGITRMEASTVNDCYNTGNVTVGSLFATSSAGGIAGQTDSTITNCYSIGEIKASSFSNAYAGGIAGITASSVTNCYYAIDKLNYNGNTTERLVGFGAAVIDGGTVGRPHGQDSGAKNTTIMRPLVGDAEGGLSIYFRGNTIVSGETVPGWDFEDVWTIMTYVNDGFPVLLAFAGEVFITEDPEDITVPEGGTAMFSALVVTVPPGIPVGYQWQVSEDGITDWEDLYGENGKGLTIRNVTMDHNGLFYRLVASTQSHTAESAAAELTVAYILSLGDDPVNGRIFWSVDGGLTETELTQDTPANFLPDTEVTLRAQEASGSQFSYWTGDITGLSTTTVMMDRHISIGAVFCDDYFALFGTDVTGGQIFWSVGGGLETELTPTTPRNFPVDTVITLRAEAVTGWEFSYWTGDTIGLEMITVTMDANKTIGVVFYEDIDGKNFTLSANDPENGQIFWSVGGGLRTELTSSTPRTFPIDTVITLKAEGGSGYEFSYWTGDTIGLSITTVTMDAHRSVGAVFYHDVDGEFFTLSGRSVTNGQIFWSVDGGLETELTPTTPRNFPVDTVIDLEARAATGWAFSYWTGDVTGLETTAVTMNDHAEVGAVFYRNVEGEYFTLSGKAVTNGQMFWSIDGGIETELTLTTSRNFPVDTVIDLEARAATGWAFSYWTGDTIGLSTTTIKMDEHRSVGAVFYEDVEGRFFTLSLADESLTDISRVNEAEHGRVFWSVDDGLETELTLTTSRNFPIDTAITLRTESGSEHPLLYWIGDADGPVKTTVTMDIHRSVGALFGEEIEDTEVDPTAEDPGSDHRCCLLILLIIVVILLIILFLLLRRRRNKRLEKERLEKERLEKEKTEQERLEKEKMEKEKQDKERQETEKQEQEKTEKEKRKKEKAEKEMKKENKELKKENKELKKKNKDLKKDLKKKGKK